MSIQHFHTMRSTTLLLVFMLFSSLVSGQGISGLTLLGHWDDDTLPVVSPNNLRFAFSGCWGLVVNGREIAVVGGARSILFFDVTEPSKPTLIGKFYGSATALHEVKSYRNRVYSAAGSGSEGLMIFDLSQAPDTIIRTYQSTEFCKYSHTITVDTSSGRLYLNGSDARGSGVVVLDISQNPDKPTLLSSVDLPGGYVHDAYVRNDTFYVSSGYEGFYVFDFHDPLQPKLLAQVSTTGYNHYSGLTRDSNYAYYAEEIPQGRPVQIVDLQNLAMNEIEIAGHILDNLLPSAPPLAVPHNLFIKDDLLLVSQYEDGMLVYDIHEPLSPKLIAWYDTHPENTAYNGYFGNWGNYPWLPSGTIITVDMQNGLFLLRLDAVSASPEAPQAEALQTRVFPNPAHGRFQIDTENAEMPWQFRLFDLQGRTILEQHSLNQPKVEVQTAALPQGLFFLEVQDVRGRKHVQKVVIGG